MANFIDLTGQRFGILVVESRAENYEKYSKTHDRVLKYARWNCLCDCGNKSVVLSTDLKSKSQVSCGCLRPKLLSEAQTKHGMKWTKEYAAWIGMKDRCMNERNKKFAEYGGRGIKIQENWVDDFIKFYEYVGPAPSSTHSLDRIDSNGNYEEGNVKWSTPSQQSHNTRKPKNGRNKYKWVTYHKKTKKYVAGFSLEGVYYRGYFATEEDAAIDVYSFYKELTGDWPKYCDEALSELGLNDDPL